MSQTVALPTVPSHPDRRPSPGAEAEDLGAELRRALRGEVRFDDGSRALYAADLSMYRQVPVGVVIPRDLDDVVAACRRRGVPILGRGCGTSLAGQCCNVAVVIDFSKYVNHITELDPGRRSAWVEPGVICDQLREAAERHHLTLAPDPATHAYCTLGGMIGNNSCGSYSWMGGKTSDNTEELEVLTYDGLRLRVGPTSDADLDRLIAAGGRRGAIYRGLRDLRDRYAGLIRRGFPHISRRVSGYNLEALLPENGCHVARALVGSESTCVLVLGARMRLVPSPPFRSLLVIGYSDPFQAGDHIPPILEYHPIALEAVTCHVIENMKRKGKPVPGAHLLPDGNTWLLVEFGGDSAREAADRANQVLGKLRAQGEVGTGSKVLTDPGEQKAVWKVREAGVGASRVPHVEDALPSWEDSAVSPERLGDYLRDFAKLLHRYHYDYTLFGHFGQGCVHSRITFHTRTPEGVRQYRAFMNDAADLVVSYGGSLPGEHGDGQAKGELLPKMFGPKLMEAFREFKRIWDPDWKMNPGKLIDANPLTSNLRYGPDYSSSGRTPSTTISSRTRPRPPWRCWRRPADRSSCRGRPSAAAGPCTPTACSTRRGGSCATFSITCGRSSGRGIPVVGLEPSCVAVFRDELVGLFPDDEDARRLSQQSFLLSEFLVQSDYRPPRLERPALVHGHCHHKALRRGGDGGGRRREGGPYHDHRAAGLAPAVLSGRRGQAPPLAGASDATPVQRAVGRVRAGQPPGACSGKFPETTGAARSPVCPSPGRRNNSRGPVPGRRRAGKNDGGGRTTGSPHA